MLNVYWRIDIEHFQSLLRQAQVLYLSWMQSSFVALVHIVVIFLRQCFAFSRMLSQLSDGFEKARVSFFSMPQFYWLLELLLIMVDNHLLFLSEK